MPEEIFEIFDEENRIIGTAPRSEVHRRGLYHRAVNVFVVDLNEYVFLQKRSENKDTEPGCWSTVGEHLKPGETYAEAAYRGLQEELKVDAKPVLLRGPKLIHVEYEKELIDNEFDEMYVAYSNGPFMLNPEEIEECMFFTIEEIDKYIADGSMDFSKFFLAEWPEFKCLLFSR